MSFRVKDLIISGSFGGSLDPDCGGCSGGCTGTDCPGGCSNGDTNGCTANTGSQRCGPDAENRAGNPPPDLLELRAALRFALSQVNQHLYPVREPQTVAEADLVEQQLKQALQNLDQIRAQLKQ